MDTPWQNDDPAAILRSGGTIAMVGLSSDPSRPSYGVAEVLKKAGYTIVPVNPGETEVLGQRSYPDLRSLPMAIEVVDIFRNPRFVPAVVDDAIAIGARTVWMQPGAEEPEAAAKARAAGLKVVMHTCMASELRRLSQQPA